MDKNFNVCKIINLDSYDILRVLLQAIIVLFGTEHFYHQIQCQESPHQCYYIFPAYVYLVNDIVEHNVVTFRSFQPTEIG